MKPTFPRISAVVITHNESENIRACLTALQKVADEIVVVDSMSDDDTVDICVAMGVKVVSRKWQGYSATKNYGNQICINDWILSIDADEVLSDELIESIKSTPLKNGNVYALDRINYYCGKWIRHCGWYPDWKVRIFHRKEVQWEGDYVHERLNIPSDLKTHKLQGQLHHHTYKSPSEHLARIDRYSELAAHQLFAANRQPSKIYTLLAPPLRFWKIFLFKLGFLDGHYGYLISKHDAYGVQKKYEILEKLNQQKSFNT